MKKLKWEKLDISFRPDPGGAVEFYNLCGIGHEDCKATDWFYHTRRLT